VKYRHSFHAGNFADLHKHVTLLALIGSFKRKNKGFAYFETHAGRGSYDLHPTSAAATGVHRFVGGDYRAAELQALAALLNQFRASQNKPHGYPGSPLIAAHELRPQDRGTVCEILPTEARLLEQALESHRNFRIERSDGFERLRASLPPKERRGLILIDPAYEESHQDLQRVTAAIVDGLQRFATGVYAAWYPIKDYREVNAWQEAFARTVAAQTLIGELWLYPRDSKVALNGSGMLIVNPPYQLAERMQVWLPELQARLDVGHPGGSDVRLLAHPG
jgi:23S rRNA (adenine2030-N6)-methyltransferase